MNLGLARVQVASIVREAFVADEEDIVEQDVTLKALPLSGMPAGKTKVHILAATDPFDISVRLSSWDPMPDYLYSALSKDFSDETRKKKRILPKEGRVCVAKLPGGSWERVQLVKPSATMGHQGYWVVFAVDVGVYHLAHEKNLQPLSSSVLAFDKVLLAKCQVSALGRPAPSPAGRRAARERHPDLVPQRPAGLQRLAERGAGHRGRAAAHLGVEHDRGSKAGALRDGPAGRQRRGPRPEAGRQRICQQSLT